MANYGTYATVAQLKAELGQTAADTVDNGRLLRKLEATSRAIDGASMGCGREFYIVTEARYFTASHSDRLLVDDLLVVTELATDEDGDGTYETVWTASDYLLDPANSWPKWMVKVHPAGGYSFPLVERGVRITGQHGYGDGESAAPYEASGATVTVADAVATTVTVSDQSLLAVGQTILVESEQMYVTALADGTPDTATVKRGVNGTTAAAHNAKPASIYRYPDPIREACLIQASRLFKRGDAPFGIAGSAEYGTVRISTLDPDVRVLLGEFRKVTVG